MSTISPFAAGSYVSTRSTFQLLNLKDQLNDLSTQLTSGRTSQTYGGLGTGRTSALAAQASISSLIGYGTVIDTAQTRAKLGTTSMAQVVAVATDTNTTLQNGLQSTSTDTQAAKSTALNNLNAALDALNQTDGSVFLFGGRDGSKAPVLDSNSILYGTTDGNGNVLDGLTDLIGDQVTADLGTDKNGRLTQAGTGPITLTEDATARATPNPFGFSIASMTASNGTNIAVTQTATSPAAYSIDVPNQPAVGDTLTIKLGLPDGSTTSVTLQATAASEPGSVKTFTLGATPADTAANLSIAVGNALTNAAKTTLTANATARASSDFFSASTQANTFPRRIPNPTGTPSYVAGTATNTVVWYQGETGTSPNPDKDARITQSFQIGPSATVALGARANEQPIQKVLAGLATVALGMPSGNPAGMVGAYEAIANAASPLLASITTSPSVQDIVTDFSLASARMTNAAAANGAQQSTLQDTVDGIEQASTEVVATKLMDLQTRLQASYQVTASLSKLSLVNYIN
jgi:hypothetical protein